MSEEKKESYQLVEVPTEMGLAIKTPSGENISQPQLLVEIANKLDDISNAVK